MERHGSNAPKVRGRRRRSKAQKKALAAPGNNPNSNSFFKGRVTANFGPNIGFPDRLKCRLKYSETITFSGSATPAAVVFAVNSLFDPNFSGVGHQPSQFDVLTLIYLRYLVEGVEATIELSNTTSTMSATTVAAYSDQNTSSQTVESLSESRYCKGIMLGAAGSNNTKRINMPFVKMARLMGSKYLEGDDNMYAPVSASPADLGYLIVKAAASDGVTTIVVLCRVTLVFNCVFKDLATSYPSLIKSDNFQRAKDGFRAIMMKEANLPIRSVERRPLEEDYEDYGETSIGEEPLNVAQFLNCPKVNTSPRMPRRK